MATASALALHDLAGFRGLRMVMDRTSRNPARSFKPPRDGPKSVFLDQLHHRYSLRLAEEL